MGALPTSQLYTWFVHDMGLFNIYFYESESHLAVLREAKDHSRTQGIRPSLCFHMTRKGEKHTEWNRNSERVIKDILAGHHVPSLSIKAPPAMLSAPYSAWVLHVHSFGLLYRASRSYRHLPTLVPSRHLLLAGAREVLFPVTTRMENVTR